MATQKGIALLLACSLIGSAHPSTGLASGIRGNVSIGLGAHWAPVRALFFPALGRRRVPEPAVHALLGHSSIPIVLEGYGSRNRQEVNTATEYTFQQTAHEVGIGLAGIWNMGPIRAHFGGGIARVMNQWKPVEGSEGTAGSRTSSGPFISAGAFLPIASGFNVGAVGRYTDADADYGRKLGGWSANALLGWGWHRSR